jgi:uncharacterized protein (DUF3820 family)
VVNVQRGPDGKPIYTDDTPMPFGKHKGTELGDVPDDYLWWCYENVKPDTPEKAALMRYINGLVDSGLIDRPDDGFGLADFDDFGDQ